MSNLDIALEYLERGWSIFPIIKGTKNPRIKWAEFQETRASPAKVRGWYQRHPEDGIAIVCGKISGLVVVDIDPDKGGGYTDTPESTYVVSTGSGGWHFYYTYPRNYYHICNQVNAKPGVDVRADGGYVIAPPSLHPNGKVYKWRDEPDPLTAMPEPPSWACEKPEPSSESTEPKEKWLSRLLDEGAPEGERNSSLIRMAGYYAKLNFPMDAALILAHQWNDGLNDSLPQSEVITTVKSAYKAEWRKTKDTLPLTPEKAKEILPMVTFGEYMLNHGGVDVNWLVKDWVPEATVAWLLSPPQAYKSFLVYDLAVSVASGAPFLGEFAVTRRGPVAIFQQEDPHGNTAERLSLIAFTRMGKPFPGIEGDDLVLPEISHADLPIFMHEDRQLRFDDEDKLDALEKFIEVHRPIMVIIDPFYSTVNTEGDEYMAKAALKMLRLKSIRDKYGCSFVIVHHTTKNNGSWDRQKMWGSQFLNAAIETSWIVKKPPNDDCAVILRHTKVRGTKPFIRVNFDMSVEHSPLRYATTTEDISLEDAQRVAEGQDIAPAPDKPNELENLVYAVLLKSDGPLLSGEIGEALHRDSREIDGVLRGLLHKHRARTNRQNEWILLDPDEDGVLG